MLVQTAQQAVQRHVSEKGALTSDVEAGSCLECCPVYVQIADQAVQRHANDSKVNWLDHGTEHPHRIALSVHVSSLQDCLSHLRHGFEQRSVQVSNTCQGSCPVQQSPPAYALTLAAYACAAATPVDCNLDVLIGLQGAEW